MSDRGRGSADLGERTREDCTSLRPPALELRTECVVARQTPTQAADDLVVPLAAHVEAVAWALPRHHLLPYLLIDWTGLRVGAIRGHGSVTLTSDARRCSPGRRSPRTGSRCGLVCTTCCSRRWSRRCRLVRIATSQRRSSPGSATPVYEPRSRERAVRRAPPILRRTGCASDAGRSSANRATPSRRSQSGSATPRS